MDSKSIKQFAKLILKFGVNLQNGQCFELSCPVTEYKVARIFIDTAYEMGAKYARVRWNDEKIDASTYLNADEIELINVPKWFVLSKNELVEKNFCYVAISAEDPYAFKGVPEDKIARIAKARSKALKKFSDTVMANGIRWCVVSVPTLQWAKSVFPNSKKPEKDLWQEIFKTMRLDCDNPEQQWQEHVDKLIRHANQLNDFNFDYLHFANSLGTDLKIGLADNHVWLSALEKAKDGVNFIANMPTEEVFTAPHRLKADGKLYSAMPLVYNGNIIDKFSLTFKEGKIVDYSAEKGYSTLKGLIETDNGTLRLGEVALIGKNSPIAKSGILFYNTLFDENASCHLAIGKAYPTTIKNGSSLSTAELKDLGANDSVEHVDFMIGTDDLIVTGITKDGKKIPVFTDGDWVI